MRRLAQARTRWLVVVLFAVAMAWLEAATVYYLRVMVDRVDPYQPNPLPMDGIVEPVELAREAATLVMLAAVGALAGRNLRTRLGYAAIAFGVWDVFYYVFLKFISGWPASLLDWDILFLLPLPWWGPVLAPVCIALLMIAWGTQVTQRAAGRCRRRVDVNRVAPELARDRARPLRVHGRRASRRAERSGRDKDWCCRPRSTGRSSSSRWRSWPRPLRTSPGKAGERLKLGSSTPPRQGATRRSRPRSRSSISSMDSLRRLIFCASSRISDSARRLTS